MVTGGVKSNMNDNNIKDPIAPNSFYYPGKEAIERVINGEISLKHQTSSSLYAEKVVRHVLSKYPSAQFFAGDKSTSLWLLDTFTWRTVYVSLFPSHACWCGGNLKLMWGIGFVLSDDGGDYYLEEEPEGSWSRREEERFECCVYSAGSTSFGI